MTLQCTVCGYVHDGEGPPEACPVCGADKGKFVERRSKMRLEIDGE